MRKENIIECKFTEITKRDGTKEEFNEIKITNAIYNAYKEVKGKISRKKAKSLCASIISELNELDKIFITIEDVQNIVEQILAQKGDFDVAKAYIIYRKSHENKREEKLLDTVSIVSNYLDSSDWKVFENANTGYSFPGLIAHISGKVLSSYALNGVYPDYIAKHHLDGDFHIHDISEGAVIAYCAGWSLEELLLKGFVGLRGRASARPAKHLDVALLQIVNFVTTTQAEFSGAQAENSVDTYLAPFIRSDNLSYEDVKHAITIAVYGLNIPNRLGQAAFVNFSFDWTVPEDLKEMPVIIGGKYMDTCYKDYQKEMDMINKAFIEVMLEGDAKGSIFSFPIPTYNITKNFDWDSENANLLFKMTAKYGIPYFQNFINSDLKESDVRSMCCRLRIDVRELQKRTGGLFGSGSKTGSIGVCTINLPRIGYLSKTEDEYFDRLSKLMDIAKESIDIKRDYIERNLKKGIMPYTAEYLENFNNHFSTIGVCGGNESCLNFMGKDLSTEEGISFMLKVLAFMNKKLQDYQEEGYIWNLEATPAEGTSHSLALKDINKYPDIIQASKETPYYTNSTQLPVGYTNDLFDAIEKQNALQSSYSGGTVFHAYIGEPITGEQAKYLIKTIMTKYTMPYVSLTPTFSICPEHGYIAGEHFECPVCK